MAVVLFTLPVLGEITLGTALAVAAGVAELLLAKGPTNPTPKAMTSAWGETWPIIYNSFRVPGKCLQAGELVEHDVKVGPGKKTQAYSLTFAMGLCEGPVTLGRIWVDNKVIYDPRSIALPPVWQANHLYGQGDQVLPPGHTDWILTATVNGESGASAPSFNLVSDGATRDNEVVWLATKYTPRTTVGKQYDFNFQFYPGSETQMPDSALEALVGVGSQPAHRGTAYCVFYDFDLSRYGNRIPNFEFEVFAENTAAFDNDGQFFGTFGANIDQAGQFLPDDATGLYSVQRNGNGNVTSIKSPLSSTVISNVRTAADAAALGWPHGSFDNRLASISGKYFCAVDMQAVSLSAYNIGILLYQIETDGSATAIGVKEYLSVAADIGSIAASGLSSSTGELLIVGFSMQIAEFDRIVDLIGSYAIRPFGPTRGTGISEIGGGGAPGPYNGYCLALVGDLLYCTLNKAHMDFIAGGGGGNAYYISLQPTHPNGTLVRIRLIPGLGHLSYTFVGPVTDFGWPFSDEGKNLAGNPGQTNIATYDDWSPPCQIQDTDGNVQQVIFVRGYSDAGARNLVGLKQFSADLSLPDFPTFTLQGAIDGTPFGTYSAFPIDKPRAYFAPNLNAIYMNFTSAAGQGYARIGAFIPGKLTLADICTDVSKRVGLVLAQMNYAGLIPVVPEGVGLLQRETARSFIESMQPAYFFDLTDIGTKIVGSLRSADTIVQVIPEGVLASAPAPATQKGTVIDRISSVRNDDLEIPEDMSITYYDLQHDYQQGSQQARRSKVTMYSSGKNTVTVPVVMTPWEANNAVQRGLLLLWVERILRKIILPPEYLARTPVDVVEIQRGGRNYVVRLTNVKLKTNWTLECDSVSEDLGTYSVVAGMPFASLGSGSFVAGTINPPTTPVLAVIDTATLRPDDLTLPGVYVAAANSDGGQYDTVTVQESPDDSIFTNVATLPNEAAIGTVAVALGAPRHYAVWDSVNTITVSLLFGTLASADKWVLTADLTTNLAWLSNGEIIQFATATLNGDGTYTLSGLRRGRLGTEQFCNTHGPNETLVMLTQAVMGNVTYSASDINATRYWQALNDAPVNPASAVQTLTMTTRRLLPYAPTRIKGSRDMAGNLTITGIRRARWHGQPLWHPAETDTPVTEEVDILNGMAVARTLTTTLSANGSGITVSDNNGVFTAYYAVADQVIDFGSAQASVSQKAYLRNATIGRGYGEARAV